MWVECSDGSSQGSPLAIAWRRVYGCESLEISAVMGPHLYKPPLRNVVPMGSAGQVGSEDGVPAALFTAIAALFTAIAALSTAILAPYPLSHRTVKESALFQACAGAES